MSRWVKTSTQISRKGTVIQYANADYPGILIESRKMPIPRAADQGYWMHTSYFLIHGEEEKEYWRLKDAIEAAEKGGWT